MTVSLTRPATVRKPTDVTKTVKSAWWYIACLLVLVVLLYPIAWLLSASVKSGTEIISNLSLIPETFSPENFAVDRKSVV